MGSAGEVTIGPQLAESSVIHVGRNCRPEGGSIIRQASSFRVRRPTTLTLWP